MSKVAVKSTHHTKLEQKRTAKKKQQSGDSPNEKREVVMHGAKLHCPYAQGLGQLFVTSNEIKLQDQLWGTVKDGNNMLNLQFKGTCGHPKWPAQNMSPPPCMSVIKLSPWKNPGTTLVQGHKVLVKESFITCMPDFNVAVPKPMTIIPPLPAPGNTQKSNVPGNVIDAYWVDKDENKTNCLKYSKELKAAAKIIFDEAAIGKQCSVKVLDIDGISNDKIITHSFQVDSTAIIMKFDVTGELFTKGGDNVQQWMLEITFEKKTRTYCNNAQDALYVSIVVFVPGIMRANNWSVGAAIQELWFQYPRGKSYKDVFDHSIIKMDWYLTYARAKKLYDSMVNAKVWVNEAGRNRIIDIIKRYIRRGNLTLPDGIPKIANFGTFSLKKDYDNATNEHIPILDLDYIQSRVYEESRFQNIDDLYCALGDYNMHIAVTGFVYYINADTYGIAIKEIGVYLKDKFDYDGFQPLGFWSPQWKKANKADPENISYFYVGNSTYREYAARCGFGRDTGIYSDVLVKQVNDHFRVNAQLLKSRF